MSEKHTPGPWTLLNDEKYPDAVIDSNGEFVCDTGGNLHNARLIASAPDLLAALEGLVQTFVDGSHYETQNPYTRPQIKTALAAIAKAKA